MKAISPTDVAQAAQKRAFYAWAYGTLDVTQLVSMKTRLNRRQFLAYSSAFAAADAFLTRPYRAGWEVPGLA